MRLWIRLIPPFLVRFFARPYVAGDSLEKAMDAAATLWQQRGLLSTLDLLAEDIHDEETAERNVATYFQMIDACATDARFGDDCRPTVSLKLSSYTTRPMDKDGDAHGARQAVFRIVEHARRRGIGLTVDMESRHWTDHTLRLLQDLHDAGHDHVGGVLQTRLNRTADDLDALPPGIRVRLVIGIYSEPETVAVTDKPTMKARMLEYAERLLQKGHHVEFATHDEATVRRLVDEVIPRIGVGPERYEIQLLYGVPREKLLAGLRQRGIRARLYVPFALGWDMAIQYLRRRLDEFPAMIWLVAKNMFRRR